ncbi:UNVERIFIED_CONTAM: putative complex I intermediate-associated protein 30 [Sesamum calycinum]|uniref:Complex I intermediate-associated protein 30 n=1 Tax=Sesamum calycinum TaxID=2727403 RepID=A0AAW2NFZ7_9LAMI
MCRDENGEISGCDEGEKVWFRHFKSKRGDGSIGFKKSLERTALTWNLEDLVPPSERYIFKFDSKEELKRWHLYSDSEYGVFEEHAAKLWCLWSVISIAGDKESVNGSSGTGVFSGNLSLDVDESSRWNISRSGFCGMRSKKFDGFIDLDAYDTLALKVKGDGRCYISTIYTENWVNSPGQQEDNSWQAFVFVPKGNWYIAKASPPSPLTHTYTHIQIPLARYLPTWRGNVIDAKLEMNPSRVSACLYRSMQKVEFQALGLVQVIFKLKLIGLKL